MAHIVTCIYCKKKFDRDKFPFIQVSQRRYAHQECSLTEDQKKDKEEQDKIDLLPLINHVGETISVVHFNRFNGCTKLDREIEAVITQVDKFSDTDIWYLQYEPLLQGETL